MHAREAASSVLAAMMIANVAGAQAIEPPAPTQGTKVEPLRANADSLPPAPMPPVTPAPAPALEVADAKVRINPEAPLESGPTPMRGKWNPIMYGFAEFDGIHDSTQSFGDVAGNGAIVGGYAAKHPRTQFGVRNSRLGFRLSAPEMNEVKITGTIEMDFLGNQPGNPPTVTENAFYASPTMRVRHFAMKLENPIADLLIGQYWQLFGWQTYFHPATVEIQGVPGQLFSRAPQIRLSHTFRSCALNLEFAAAASRPPQRDSGFPDGQAGLRLLLNPWKGVHTMGGAATAVDAAAVGVSGVARRFAVPEYSGAPSVKHTADGWGISMDLLLPVIAGTLEDRGNALTVMGSFVTGRGIADLYTGLGQGYTTGGATAANSWPLPNPTNLAAPGYIADIDNGLIEFDSGGRIHPIHWQSYIVGAEYYLPPRGHLWVALNYAHMRSSNVLDYVTDAARGSIFDRSEWYDANLFWDPTIATRFGVELAHARQTFGDGSTRSNDRAQVSGWLLFL